MLHDILDDDRIQWHLPLIGHYTNFLPLLIWTLLPNLTFYLIVQGFHRIYATGVACQQRTLSPPDTWSCPTLGLACVLMSRPISPELVLSPDFWNSNIPRYFSFAWFNHDRKKNQVTWFSYIEKIIERTIDVVLDLLKPSKALSISLLEHCTLTNKAMSTIWQNLSKLPWRGKDIDPRPLWLLVGTPSALVLSPLSDGWSIAYLLGCLFIFLIHYFQRLRCLYYGSHGLPLCFSWLLILGLYKEGYIQKVNVCAFDCTAFALSGKDNIS